jgi:hypothetical protein
MKINIAEAEKSEEVSVQLGEYSRTFKRAEQPFDVTDEEWTALATTKLFEPAKAAKRKPAAGEQAMTSK